MLGRSAGKLIAALSVLGKPIANTGVRTRRALDISDRGPRSFVNSRITKHLNYVAQDDSMLSREGSGSLLTLAELRGALSERG